MLYNYLHTMKKLKMFFIGFIITSFFAVDFNTVSAQTNPDPKVDINKVFSAVPQSSGTIQYGNKSFSIGGVGAALSGCLGAGQKVTTALYDLASKLEVGTVGTNSPQTRAKECSDALAYAASRLVVQNMAMKTTNWVTSGNNGNPFYPTNYTSLYSNIRSGEVKNFITELQSADSSNPYNSSFAKSLASNARSKDQTFAEKYAYTGPKPEFFDSFKNGGWDAWYKYILEPQNNPLGYSQIASQEAENRQNQAVQTTAEELANNDGFLSQKKCDDKNYIPWKNDAEKASTIISAAKGDKLAIVRMANATCKNFKIITPGSIISQQLKDVLGSPLRQAEQINRADQALGSVFDAIVSNLVNKGLSSLSSSSFKDNVDFSYNNPGSQNPGYNTATGGSFWDQYNSSFDLRRDLPGIIKTQKDYVDQLEKNNEVLILVLQSIDKMDDALPGPRVGWDENLDEAILAISADMRHQAGLWTGGIIGNLKSLGMKNQILDGVEQMFIKTLTTILNAYRTTVNMKFNPALNFGMPTTSTKMVGLIRQRQTYEEIINANSEEIVQMKDIIDQLNVINKGVIDLYARACARFKAENPGTTCI